MVSVVSSTATPKGAMPTVTVAVTVLVAPAMTDTVCDRSVGGVDGVGGLIDRHTEWVGADSDGGGHSVGGPVDHRHRARLHSWRRRWCRWSHRPPQGQGVEPTAMVAVTVLVAPSITDTVSDR